MRLYDGFGPSPQIVRTFIAEKGVKIERVPVDVGTGANRQEAFLVLNPLGQIPVLATEHGGNISESTAICEYLEEVYPAPALIGANAAERADTRMWVRRIDFNVIAPFMDGFRATGGRSFFQDRMPLLSEDAGKEALSILETNLRQFDKLLAGRDYVAGNRFSLADITLGSFLRFAPRRGVALPEGLGWIPGWLERIGKRPSFEA